MSEDLCDCSFECHKETVNVFFRRMQRAVALIRFASISVIGIGPKYRCPGSFRIAHDEAFIFGTMIQENRARCLRDNMRYLPVVPSAKILTACSRNGAGPMDFIESLRHSHIDCHHDRHGITAMRETRLIHNPAIIWICNKRGRALRVGIAVAFLQR